MAGEKGGFEACMDRHPVTKPNITGQGSPGIIISIVIIITHVSFPSLISVCEQPVQQILMGAVGIGDGVSSGEGTVDSALACLLT